MEIQIVMPNKKAVENFVKWFNEEGYRLFSNSKYNKLNKKETDSYISCLATDEQLTEYGGDYAGHFFELQ